MVVFRIDFAGTQIKLYTAIFCCLTFFLAIPLRTRALPIRIITSSTALQSTIHIGEILLFQVTFMDHKVNFTGIPELKTRIII